MGGDCYRANGRYLLNSTESGLKLIHGIAILQTDGKPFGHCWLEKGNKVYDFSNGKNITMDKKVYYFLGGIPVKGFKNYEYTAKQVNEKINKYEHWGPWDSKPPR